MSIASRVAHRYLVSSNLPEDPWKYFLKNRRGVDVFMHDIEKFYRESHVISMAKYTAMVTRLARR